MKKNITIILLILGLFSICFGGDKIKFGKVSMEEMTMKNYDQDTSASAVIISDIGEARFEYSDPKESFMILYDRHVRIKIFNKNAYDWANIELKIYKSSTSSDKEIISSIKGFTYNLENGEIEKTKLDKDGILTTEINENWDKVSITLPQIKEGCVFDLKYNLSSDFLYNFPDWQFQYSIPVIYSSYSVEIPEYFHYEPISYGYEYVSHNEETKRGELTYSYYQEVNVAGGSTVKKKFYDKVEYLTRAYNYEANNMPAFKKEPYITAVNNYINRIEHELSYIKYPWSLRKDYSKTWESINKNLMEDDKFGLQLGKSGFLKDDLEEITAGLTTTEEKIMAIHTFIVNKMKWNGRNSVFVSGSLKDSYKSGSGNSANINFILINMLNEAGISAHPVVLSTRSNGLIHPAHASVANLNYVLAYVKDGDHVYLLDATNKNIPYYLIPGKCINHQGRLISENFTDWVDLTVNQNYEKVTMNQLSLDEQGIFTGKISNRRRKYSAVEFRDDYKAETEEKDFIKTIEKDKPGLKINNYTFKNIDSCYADVTDEYEVEIEGQAESMGNNIYFNPLLFDALKSNVFKLEDRKYPVDYTYPFSKTIINRITIPENYEIDFLPKAAVLALPDKAGRLVYNIVTQGNMVMVTFKFEINKSIFLPNEYQNLKLFYDEMVKKESEQVVLKKKI